LTSTAATESLRALVEAALTERDLELFDLQVGGGIVRVFIDKEGGVDLEEVTATTQALTRLLEDSDPMPGRYTLEVTSPGIERNLRLPVHFVRAVGEIVRVKSRAEIEGERRFEGELLTADDTDDGGIDVATSGGPRRIAYREIDKARTVFDWDRAMAKTTANDTSGEAGFIGDSEGDAD
jgi:ribosome maturation factor RimP